MKNDETGPKSGAIKLKVHLSAGASMKLSQEEAQMLIKWVWEEMEKKTGEGRNMFRFPKMGICIVREGNELLLMTDEEHRSALKDEHVGVRKEKE